MHKMKVARKTDVLDRLTPCMGCGKKTKSRRKGGCGFCCVVCGHDKTLGDVYFAEAARFARVS